MDLQKGEGLSRDESGMWLCGQFRGYEGKLLKLFVFTKGSLVGAGVVRSGAHCPPLVCFLYTHLFPQRKGTLLRPLLRWCASELQVLKISSVRKGPMDFGVF